MNLDLTCTECDGTFEVDAQSLLDDPKTLTCPNCDAKAPARKVEALASALEDLLGAMEELAPKFVITLTAETDDLPAEDELPARGRAKAIEEDEEDDEDLDDEDEDSELEFNE